jgi:hypothetical protein
MLKTAYFFCSGTHRARLPKKYSKTEENEIQRYEKGVWVTP